MDSEFDSRLQGLAEPAQKAASPLGRLRSVAERIRRHRRHLSRRPVRFMSMDWRRVAGLFVAVTLLVSAITIAAVLQEHRLAARLAAQDTVAFVERRLAEIDAEVDRLAAALAVQGSADTCSPQTAMTLARASMQSLLVHRFSIGTFGDAQACFPDGPGPAQASPQESTGELAIYSTGEIALRLLATRAVAGGRTITALVDARAFDRRMVDDEADRTTLPSIHTTLISADGRRLIEIAGAGRDPVSVASLGAVAASRHHGATVHAGVSASGLRAAIGSRLLTVLSILWVVFAAFVALAWRRSVLRGLLANRIEHGLRKRQFEPYVQPIVDLSSGRCSGGEVLMRWAHPERGILTPGEFIEEAERTRLIVGMSDLVMERAAHRLARVAALHPEMYFSFNITPAQLRQRQFTTRLGELFHAGTIPPPQVLLEVTEREFVGATGAKVLASLHKAGWRIAIDDFGTGQSSLAALEQLPIDRIKIDIAFVRSIGEQGVNRPVLDAIIALANQLQLPMIAEGVETERQLNYLASRGVQYAQGFLIGRPMRVDVFEKWLADYQAAGPDTWDGAPQAVLQARSPVDLDVRQLWHRLGSRGGLDIRDRVYWLRSYPQSFIGREAVDWMVRQLGVARSEAVSIGRRMLALGLFEHVMQEHNFEDAELYYRLASTATDEVAQPAIGEDLRTAIGEIDGVVMGKHSRGLVRHRQCAPGSAIVDWICARYQVPRATALQWAAQLMRRGVLRHVYDDRPMRDDRNLYRVS